MIYIKNQVRFTIYALIFILASSSFYIVKVYLLPNGSPVYNTDVPKSIFTGEPSKNPGATVKSATYVSNETSSPLYGLGDADIVFEYSGANDKIFYDAIFNNTIPAKISPVIDFKEGHSTAVPKLNFSTADSNSPNWTKPSEYIFVNFTPNLSSNFIYNDQKYYHYRNTNEDIDSNDNSHIAISNIIIQVVDNVPNQKGISSIKGKGSGFAFTKGKSIEIKWERKDDGPIKIIDEYGNPITLSPGHTWWVIVDKDCSVLYK